MANYLSDLYQRQLYQFYSVDMEHFDIRELFVGQHLPGTSSKDTHTHTHTHKHTNLRLGLKIVVRASPSGILSFKTSDIVGGNFLGT